MRIRARERQEKNGPPILERLRAVLLQSFRGKPVEKISFYEN